MVDCGVVVDRFSCDVVFDVMAVVGCLCLPGDGVEYVFGIEVRVELTFEFKGRLIIRFRILSRLDGL